MPVSVTSTSQRAVAVASPRAITEPPRGVNLSAFETRLSSTCRSRPASASSGSAAVDVEAELDPVLGGGRQGVLDGRGGQLGEVGRREPELEPARPRSPRRGGGPRRCALQAVVAAADDLDVLAAGGAELVLLVAEQLEEARDRGERRAQLVRDRGDERVAQALEAPVGGHLAQRPDPSDDGSVLSGDRRRVAAEDAAALGELELVLARGEIACQLLHPLAEARRLGRPVGEREQPLGDRAVQGQAELEREALQRGVREDEVAGHVGEADAVDRRVEQCPLQRARRLQLERVRRDAARGEPGGDADADERHEPETKASGSSGADQLDGGE